MDISEKPFDVIENIEKHIQQMLVSKDKQTTFDIIENIGKHVRQLTP